MPVCMESNFDGLIGPTHNYGGLSDGNLASGRNAGRTSYPKKAALQGLEKMRLMHDSGLWQGILPPQQRPFLPLARALGFSGQDISVYQQVWKQAPGLARNMLSASSMWAANAATISPSPDTHDGKLHMSPANLSTMLHRAIEHPQTQLALSRIFPFAKVHAALPEQSVFSDEGAANHVRLCGTRGECGVEIFVYGRDGYAPLRGGFPARQTVQASEAIARRHGLAPERTVYARQSDKAIAAGAFHNDVVCVGALGTLFFHEDAFADTEAVRAKITAASKGLFTPKFVMVPTDEVPLEDAISAYLFNSMLVQFPGDDRLTVVAPLETQETPSTRDFCERLVAGNGPIGAVKFVDVRQSMQNGGGPACLRLRVTLFDYEWEQVNPGVVFTPKKHTELTSWVNRYYRDTLEPKDLPDPSLMTESFEALDALTHILELGRDFYPFQRG